MNEIILLGLNHTTAPIALRECIAFSEQEAIETLSQISKEPMVKELLIFSTCNRVEILMTSPDISEAI